MASVPLETSRPLHWLGDAFARLREQMGELGLTVSLWDRQGQLSGGFQPPCAFCQAVYGQGARCEPAARKLAWRVLADGSPGTDRAPWGCCLVGVPVYQRRRLLGATVGCYPPREMLREGFLVHQCDALHLDRRAMADLARTACRHCETEAEDFLRVLEWLGRREQDVQTAQQELAKLSDNLASTYEELSLLYRISGSMKVTQLPVQFLQNVCGELLEVMNIEAAAAVAYAYPTAVAEDLVVLSGDLGLGREQVKALAAEHVAVRFQANNRGLLDNDFRVPDEVGGRLVRSVVAVPLVNDTPVGALIALNKIGREFDSVDMKLLISIGNQATIFLANSRLYADLHDLLMGVLHALTATIDAKDPYTCGHSRRVALLSKRLAEACGYDAERVQQIYLSGLLHDIGKIGVPESVLCKAGRLTDEEYETIKKHPALGVKILGGIRQLDDVMGGILCHHERLDGRGYPRGLKGREVPMEGLIVGLADSFDAMTSDRTYRKALPIDKVIGEIRSGTGTQFHPDLVERFLAMDVSELMAELRQPAKVVFPIQV